MFTKTLVAALSVAGLTAAVPVQNSKIQTAHNFGLLAQAPGHSGIHLMQINALGSLFWIGKPTASSCPSNVANCPAGTQTVLKTSAYDLGLYMDTEVPGGQTVYLTHTGDFIYTKPGADVVPAGAIKDGFLYSAPSSPGGVGELTSTFGDFYACPSGPKGTYMIKVAVNNIEYPDCTQIHVGATYVKDGVLGAYQYN